MSLPNSLFTAVVSTSLASAPASFTGALLYGTLYLLGLFVMFSASNCSPPLARNRIDTTSRYFHALLPGFFVAFAGDAFSANFRRYGKVEGILLSVE